MRRIEYGLPYGTSLGVAGSEGGGGRLMRVGGLAVMMGRVRRWLVGGGGVFLGRYNRGQLR